MTKHRFTEEVDTYSILILHLGNYRASNRELPTGFDFVGPEQRPSIRAQEKQRLQTVFDDWDVPYCGRLPGWRIDSPVYVAHRLALVGGVYVCDQNEFDNDPARGQLHYAFMDPKFQGLGIYSVIFREAVRRANEWGLQVLYLNSDRYMLPEVYLRWGAQPWKTITKRNRMTGTTVGRWSQMLYPPLRRMRRRIRLAWQMWREPCR
jgi:GNAT superfamily N-acetyltransferase